MLYIQRGWEAPLDMRKILFTLLALLVLYAAPVAAQTGACPTSTAVSVNPSGWICITPDPEYNTMDPGVPANVPRVVGLTLLLFGPTVTDTSTGAATQTIPIGKPTMNAQGAVWVQRTELTTLPLGQLYKARTIAVGQNGTDGQPTVSARSPESNPFGRSGPAVVPRAPLRTSVPE